MNLDTATKRSLAQSIGGPARRIALDGARTADATERTATATETLSAARGNGTAATSNVADSATVVTLLPALAGRTGACFYNDSSAILYLKLGAAASTTSYTVQLAASGGYYELPFRYVGIITGVWASAPGGACRVTEGA